MSQTAIIGVAVLTMVCCSSSSAAMLMMGDDSSNTTTSNTSTNTPTEYKYEFIVEVPCQNENHGPHITDIRIDGTRATSSQVKVDIAPDHAKCNSKDGGYECEGDNYGLNDPEPASPQFIDLTWSAWKPVTATKGAKLMTITTKSKVKKFEIDYFRPMYVPGWIIKENGKQVLKETANGGSENSPNPKTVTYTIQ
jgi:hypothetical protein